MEQPGLQPCEAMDDGGRRTERRCIREMVLLRTNVYSVLLVIVVHRDGT